MADRSGTGLDERLRHALRDEALTPGPDDEVKPAVLHRLRQRRAARARVAATSAVVLVVCVAGAIVLGTRGSTPPQSALSTGAPSTTAPAGSVIQPSTHGQANASGGAAPAKGFSPSAPTNSTCAEVRIGASPPVCAGQIVPTLKSTSSPAAPEGAVATLPGQPPSAVGAQPVLHRVTVRLGHSLTVSLPGGPGVRWTVPKSRSPILERVASSTNRRTGAASARFVPRRPGTVEVVADSCPPGKRCVPDTSSYLLFVDITR
ncbi:MAG TPA: hypothetical protein VK277_05230 [Acidimicrobiales bacterium]|nr:hypothetical protein [Acidimicrobiales bacterium]